MIIDSFYYPFKYPGFSNIWYAVGPIDARYEDFYCIYFRSYCLVSILHLFSFSLNWFTVTALTTSPSNLFQTFSTLWGKLYFVISLRHMVLHILVVCPLVEVSCIESEMSMTHLAHVFAPLPSLYCHNGLPSVFHWGFIGFEGAAGKGPVGIWKRDGLTFFDSFYRNKSNFVWIIFLFVVVDMSTASVSGITVEKLCVIN